MASNLVSDAMKMATPAVVDRIAAAQGIEAGTVRNVLASAVPNIFACIARQAGTSSGLEAIVTGLRQVTHDLPASIPLSPDGGLPPAFVAGGADGLRRVIGEHALDAIVRAVSSTAGLNPAIGKSLVAIAGQMAMAALARQAAGLDPEALLPLLGSQVKSFQAPRSASPGLTSNVDSPAPAGSHLAPGIAAHDGAAAMARQDLADGGSSGWLYWLVPVIIVAATLWYYLGHKQSAMVTEPQTATAQPAATADLAVGNVDIGKLLTTGMAELSDALKRESDAAAAAQVAAAKLRATLPDLQQAADFAARLTPEQRKSVAALVNAELPKLRELAAKAEASGSAGDVLKPLIDAAMAQLEALTKG